MLSTSTFTCMTCPKWCGGVVIFVKTLKEKNISFIYLFLALTEKSCLYYSLRLLTYLWYLLRNCSFWFLDPENVGLVVGINAPAYLETEVLTNVDFTGAILYVPIWPPYTHLGKCKHSESLDNNLSKNV